MSYSQRDEEHHILNHLTWPDGTFLDIGAYHPTTFSNTRALVERGWDGVYVEPAPDLMAHFKKTYEGREGLQFIEKAVGLESKVVTFFDSQGDAIGTVDANHASVWRENYGVPYQEIQVDMITVAELLDECEFKTFDFVSIDIEGLDLQVFQQIDFNDLETRCVCVEWNGNSKQAFVDHANNFGMVLVHETPENLIFVK